MSVEDKRRHKSCILLRSVETGAWHYSQRITTVDETKKELQENPIDFGPIYSFHGIYSGWIEAVQVAKAVHEKELEKLVGKELHPINRAIYD